MLLNSQLMSHPMSMLKAVNMVRGACGRGNPFSVVLKDIEMPEMDRITATRELLDLISRGVLGSLPVIMGVPPIDKVVVWHDLLPGKAHLSETTLRAAVFTCDS